MARALVARASARASAARAVARAAARAPPRVAAGTTAGAGATAAKTAMARGTAVVPASEARGPARAVAVTAQWAVRRTAAAGTEQPRTEQTAAQRAVMATAVAKVPTGVDTDATVGTRATTAMAVEAKARAKAKGRSPEARAFLQLGDRRDQMAHPSSLCRC